MIKIDNYKIIRKIASGGMGDVFLAEHKFLEYKVAIKSLHSNLVSDKGFRERFIVEAKTQAKLSHPNIVKLLDFQEQEDGLFLIMEYIEGRQLDDYIQGVTGPMPEEKLIPLFKEILSAIQYAHSKRLIHRDIKPANILITPDGNAKIIDFGIAKSSDQDNGLTKTGIQVGTVSYMSPEQVNVKKLDKLTDIYSLGVTLFQMAVGQSPFDATELSYKIQLSIVNDPLPNPKDIYPSVSNKLVSIIQKATQKKKEDRFQSCDEFLESFKVNTPIVNKDQTKSIKKTESKTKEVSNKTGNNNDGKEIEKTKNYKFKYYIYAFLGSVAIGVLGTYLIYYYYEPYGAYFTHSLRYSKSYRLAHITNFLVTFSLTFAILSHIFFGKTFAILSHVFFGKKRFFKYVSSRKKNIALSTLIITFLKVIIHYLFYPLKSKKILKQVASSQRSSRVRTRGGSRDGENTFSYITETINTDLGEYIISSKNGELTLFTEMPLLFIPSLILFLVIIWFFNDKIKAR